MKKIATRILRSVCFFLILTILVGIFSVILMPKENKKKNGIQDSRMYGFLSEPQNSLDALIIGDSLSCYSYSPFEVWKEFGFTSYVCGKPNQYPAETINIIKQFCENQNPKVIIMEANPVFASYTLSEMAVTRLERYIPIIKNHDHWKHLQWEDFLGRKHFSEKSETKGYLATAEIGSEWKNTGYMEYSEDQEYIRGMTVKTIREISDFCKERGIDFFLYSAPNCSDWEYSKHNAVEQMVEELKIPYIDLNLMLDDLTIDWSIDTCDDGEHMNYYGARKVSMFLGTLMDEAGNLEDHREDPDFDFWHKEESLYDEVIAERIRESMK